MDKFIFESKYDQSKAIFNGIFSFTSKIISVRTIERTMKALYMDYSKQENYDKYMVNHIAFDENWFYKFYYLDIANKSELHGIYEIRKLGFSFLIINLLKHLSSQSIKDNGFLWFPVAKEDAKYRRCKFQTSAYRQPNVQNRIIKDFNSPKSRK